MLGRQAKVINDSTLRRILAYARRTRFAAPRSASVRLRNLKRNRLEKDSKPTLRRSARQLPHAA